MEQQLKKLRSKLHIKLNQQGLMQHKESMLEAYGVSSSKDMSADQLLELISKIDSGAASKIYENDKLRKKIISLLKTVGITDIEKIKAIIKEKWGKGFNSYTAQEYQKIIAVIETVWIPFYLKKIANGTKQS